MPPTMGMMMLARMIMYFCGDPDSWDKRSLMIGMMGGMMGGMGGGMMGGMGGGMMGGMGGGMRSVPPTELPSALLEPGQTRHLPTRLVSLSPPDPQAGVKLPEQGEPLQLAISPTSTTIHGYKRRFGGWPPTRSPSRSRGWSCGTWPAAWIGRRSRNCPMVGPIVSR